MQLAPLFAVFVYFTQQQSAALAEYRATDPLMKYSTSLTCYTRRFRSRIEAVVACEGDKWCRATRSIKYDDGTIDFGVCNRMSTASYGSLYDNTTELHLRIFENYANFSRRTSSLSLSTKYEIDK